MADITLGGKAAKTNGTIPQKGDGLKDFRLVSPDMQTKTMADYKGKKLVMNIFPSVDTGVCAKSIHEFNKRAGQKENTVVLNISKDLPFAQKRFCGAEGLENVEMLSDFRDGNFGKAYNVSFSDGPLAPLHSRAVVVLDEEGQVLYTEQVPEIVDEPNYKAALEALMTS